MDIDPNFTFKKSIITEIIAWIGMIGNIISFIVFSRKTFEKNAVSIYCRALAIFDMSIALSAVFDMFLIVYDYFIYNYSDGICAFYGYGYYAILSMSGWILVAFSVDRSLSLKKVSNLMKRPIVHYMILLVIILFHLLLYIEVPIYLRLSPLQINGTTFHVCDSNSLFFSDILNGVNSIESSVLPFIIMLISSFYTIKMIAKSRRNVEAIGSVTERRKNRDRKFAITSITFNVLFIVLKMPLTVFITIGYTNVNYYLYQIGFSLFFLNYSISFFVHFFTNSLFRRELFILLRFRKSLADSTPQAIQ